MKKIYPSNKIKGSCKNPTSRSRSMMLTPLSNAKAVCFNLIAAT